MMEKIFGGKNRELFRQAQRYLVGGVNSPVRSFSYVGAWPILIKRGKGSKVYDYDGNEYLDYVLSWGSLILGHAHPAVLKEIKQALKNGLSFGTTHESEIELARLIQRSIPFIERIRFVNSGTEAVMGAVRLARGYTKRDKILKFANSYHGHADYLLAKSGSGLATLSIAASVGVPGDFIKHTLVAPFGNFEFTEKIFKKYGHQIATVLVEPVGTNFGVIPPNPDFLKHLRYLTKKYGALLIFDEIITAYRFSFGSFAEQLDIVPDLICLGKIIGGGLPIGAYAGSKKIMQHLAPLGKVYQASTFSGNPIVMQSGLATLNALELSKSGYSRIQELTRYLCLRLEEEAELYGINLKITYYANMFSLKFKDKRMFRRFYLSLLEKGIYFVPSEFEANFLSFAHTKSDIERTVIAARAAFKKERE